MSSFKVYIPLQVKHQAEQLAALHKTSEQAEKVYLNYLAAYCAYVDLCRNIQIDFAGSDSNNLIVQALTDTGSLTLTEFGKLECRPVLQGSQVMYVPEEVQGDRIGYLAVQLNEDLTEGKILGFVKAVHQTQVPITDLQSLDEFMDYLDYLEKLKQPKQREAMILKLKNWISRMTQSVKVLISESISEALNEPFSEKKSAFRSLNIATMNPISTDQHQLNQIPFCISLYPCEDSEYDYNIIVGLNFESFSKAALVDTRAKESQVSNNELYVDILDENRNRFKPPEVFQVGRGATDTAGRFEFQGNQGDSFIIKVVYQGDTIEKTITL